MTRHTNTLFARIQDLEIHTDLVKLTWKNEINEFQAIDKFNYVL